MDNQTPEMNNQPSQMPPASPRRSWTMTRVRLKNVAKVHYGINFKTCVVVAFISSVASYMFSMILNRNLPGYETIMNTEDMTVFLPQLLQVNGLSLLFGLFVAPLTIGSYGFFTKLIRHEKPEISELFSWIGEGKKAAVAYLGQLLYLLFTLLWTVLLMGIPGALYVGASYLVSQNAGVVQMLLFLAASVLFFAATVLGGAKIMTYQPALFMLGADPEMGVKRAFALCREKMRGHMWEFFLFQFSFLGWQLVASFTCGLGMLLVQPYMNLANAAFTEFVQGNPVVMPQPPQMPKPQNPFAPRDEDDDDREDK